MSLTLDREHGVNPSMLQCFICTKDVGVALLGAYGAKARKDMGDDSGDRQAPHRICLDKEPCDECSGHMGTGVILISVDESKSEDMENPWRTGGWCVVTTDFIERLIEPPSMLEAILKKRMAFVPDEAWDMIGLPR